jgi:hypothetical protein
VTVSLMTLYRVFALPPWLDVSKILNHVDRGARAIRAAGLASIHSSSTKA